LNDFSEKRYPTYGQVDLSISAFIHLTAKARGIVAENTAADIQQAITRSPDNDTRRLRTKVCLLAVTFSLCLTDPTSA
jgi:hypothetical protein